MPRKRESMPFNRQERILAMQPGIEIAPMPLQKFGRPAGGIRRGLWTRQCRPARRGKDGCIGRPPVLAPQPSLPAGIRSNICGRRLRVVCELAINVYPAVAWRQDLHHQVGASINPVAQNTGVLVADEQQVWLPYPQRFLPHDDVKGREPYAANLVVTDELLYRPVGVARNGLVRTGRAAGND